MTRPFKVLGVQQIAIGGPDKGRLQKLWVEMFGLEVTGTFKSERENVDEDICAIGSGPFKVEVDLMQPLDPDKKPAVHTTPLNHIGLWIDNLPVAVEWLSQQGVRFAPGGIRKGAAGFDITFLHPKGNDEFPIGGEGVLIELVQAPDEVVKAFGALAGFCFGECGLDDGALAVDIGRVVTALGQRILSVQIGQFVFGLGHHVVLVLLCFTSQTLLSAFIAVARCLGQLG